MHVIVTGGKGFLGQLLIEKLLHGDGLCGLEGECERVDRITITDLFDVPDRFGRDARVAFRKGDISSPSFVRNLISPDVTSVFHLASLVSGGAERDFAAGLNANFVGTWNILEACRLAGSRPRLVFTSSVAAYGGTLPPVLDDDQRLTPESSYGTHKAIGELLVADYSRKGFLDGRSVRLPIIAVRPGKANTAASSWASAIVREPLAGEDYACPVAPQDRGILLSPKRAIESLVHAHESPAEPWGPDRAVMLPGVCTSAQALLDALDRIAGSEVAARVRWAPDPFIRDIVNSWPCELRVRKAARIGFASDLSIDEIVSDYIASLG